LESKGNDRVCEAVQYRDLPKHFESNLRLMFTPGCREATSSSTRTKNRNTTRRCAKLRSLDAISLVRWAVAYPRTIWAQSRIKNGLFQTLLERNNPELFLESYVCRKLNYLITHNISEVYGSDEFATFTAGLISLPRPAHSTVLTFLKTTNPHARQRQTQDHITSKPMGRHRQ